MTANINLTETRFDTVNQKVKIGRFISPEAMLYVRNTAEYMTGVAVAKELGISPSSVYKIRNLSADGFENALKKKAATIASSFLNFLDKNPEIEGKLRTQTNERKLKTTLYMLNSISRFLFDKGVDGDNKLRNLAKDVSGLERKLFSESYSARKKAVMLSLKGITYERNPELAKQVGITPLRNKLEANLDIIPSVLAHVISANRDNSLSALSKDGYIHTADLLEPMQYLNSLPSKIGENATRQIEGFLTTISQKEFCKPETELDRAVIEGLTLNLNRLAETNPSLQKSCDACNVAMEKLLKSDLQKATERVLVLKNKGVNAVKGFVSEVKSHLTQIMPKPMEEAMAALATVFSVHTK